MACNCTGNTTCGCHFMSGTSTVKSGSGSASDPVIFDVEPAFLTGSDTATVGTTVTGTGDTDNPYNVSMSILPSLYADRWGRWVGTQDQFDALPDDPSTIHVVM